MMICSSKTWFYAVVTLVVIAGTAAKQLSPESSGDDVGPETIAELLRSRVDQYNRMTAHLSGSYKETTFRADSKEVLWRSDVVFKRGRPGEAVHQVQYSGINDDLADLTVTNRKYSFTLRRQGQSGHWAISNVFENSKRPRSMDNVSANVGPYYVAGYWIPDLLADNRLAIRQVNRLPDLERQLWHIAFSIKNRKASEILVGGTLTLDQGLSFAVQRCDLEVMWGGTRPGKIHSECTFVRNDRDIVLEYHQTDLYTEKHDPGTTRHTFHVTFDNSSVDSQEFTLPFFGFQEPAWIDATWSRQKTVAVIAGLLVLATICYRIWAKYR